jgi:hypothetical protein
MLCIAPLLLFAFAPPEAAQLIHFALAADQAQNKRKIRFTYREDEERPDEKTKTYDVIMLEGESYRKLILIGGQPLDVKTSKKVDAEMEKAREERKHRRSIGFHKTIQEPDLEQVARLFDSKVTGEEEVNGRKAWRVESAPKPDATAKTPAEEEMLATKRIDWFDEEDGIQVRFRSTYVRNIHQLRAGHEMEAERGKVGDTWQFVSLTMRPNVKFMGGAIHVTSPVHYRYYDYKRFTAESTFIPE